MVLGVCLCFAIAGICSPFHWFHCASFSTGAGLQPCTACGSPCQPISALLLTQVY
ncbi:hypothetical protein DL95DRAFT_378285, partial [Leptodontidium sp. 2 PMI_412]